jgi:hypothetical protein
LNGDLESFLFLYSFDFLVIFCFNKVIF